MSHYHYDGAEYCEDCLPVDEDSEQVEYDCGEQDYPAHCCVCHQPLDYTLTSDGVEYVLDALKVELAKPIDERNELHPCYVGTWYEGSRHVEITRDWATALSNCSLTSDQQDLLAQFLEETEE
jgi:hypothetical protein